MCRSTGPGDTSPAGQLMLSLTASQLLATGAQQPHCVLPSPAGDAVCLGLDPQGVSRAVVVGAPQII